MPRANQPLPTRQLDLFPPSCPARPDQPAERGARDSGTPDGAHAREAEGKQLCQRRNGRARR